MRWSEWLVRFRAVARADALLGAAADELTMLATGASNDPGPVLRDQLQRVALEVVRLREQLKREAAPQLGDRRYLEQQMQLPEVGGNG